MNASNAQLHPTQTLTETWEIERPRPGAQVEARLMQWPGEPVLMCIGRDLRWRALHMPCHDEGATNV